MSRGNLLFWVLILAASITAHVIVLGLSQGGTIVAQKIVALDPIQEAQLGLFRERSAVLLTITTLVFGGTGALLLHFREKGAARWASTLATLAMVAASLSMIWGYCAYDAAIWMLGAQFFDVETTPLHVFAIAQLYATGMAVVLLLVCFASTGPREKVHEQS